MKSNVTMENERFMKRFCVKAENQQEAYYILTYVLICKCHEFLNKPPYNKLDYDKFIYITYSFTRKSRSFMRSVYNPAILQKPLRIAQSYSKSPLSNHFDFLEIADKILPYYKAWYDSCPECEYLLHTED